MRPLTPEILKSLEKIVGPGHLTDQETDLQCYGYDATVYHGRPEAVIFPGSAEEISAVLRLANEHRFPVVPRGAGSGMSGGSVPVQGGVVLVLNRLKRIKKIDRENFLAVVEPGVVNRDLQQAVEALGLFYPPDPASMNFSTLGGNVAECAGGARAVKYGVTRDYVLGLTAVLPTGEIMKTGVQTVKGVVGYDLTRLLVGSEGTLAVITEIILKLLPKPEARRPALAFFNQLDRAAQAVVEILHGGILPSTLEFLDQPSIQAVEDYLHLGLPREAEALLLIEVDGDREGVERQSRRVVEACERLGASGTRLARTEAEAEDLWQARRAVSPALFRLRPNKINEDIAVPRAQIPEAIRRFQEIARRFDLLIVSFGHAGDGNIHVNVMYDEKQEGQQVRARQAVEEIFKAVLALGGTLSGEHGIGLAKAAYLSWELDPVNLAVMKKIKDLLDPNGILNPGKIFPS
ncbi:MAG: FAD-binding protein [Deltaproteobacteria bacterium]|nr:FAD-binding protein [Deltaproteobacteria bacterium]